MQGFVGRAGQAVRKGLGAVALPALFLSLCVYFIWNASQGDRGTHAYALRLQQLAAVQKENEAVMKDQAAWDRRVAELRNQRLDPDMLDERARAKLDLGDPTETVVLYGPTKRLFTPP